MGSCFSSAAAAAADTSPFPSPARVVALDGSLREYTSQAKVYQALGRLHPSCFICNADELTCDGNIPALGSQDELQLGQLYFMLPVSKLPYPLSGADMATLAVRASKALTASGSWKAAAGAGRLSTIDELIG